MKYHRCLGLFLLLLIFGQTHGQSLHSPARGKLFIIGGGDRSPQLMKALLATAGLKENDYIVILPMSSEEPDTSFFYIRADFEKVCKNQLADLNFTANEVSNAQWLDSVRKAKLIFVTGGDQNRFMKVVAHTPLYGAIWQAFNRGATIAGTSAGAAIMSRQMITGNEYAGDTVTSGSFKKMRYHLVEVQEGMGLISNAIIDQHFIKRSRYNRLLSVLAEYPQLPCLGIDEATAIIVSGKKVTVTGESQIIRFSLPGQALKQTASKGLVKLRDVRLDIFTDGDSFMLP